MRISDWSSDVCSSDLDTGGQRREGQPRQDIIGLFEAVRADDLLDIGGRTMNRDEAAIADILPKIFDEILVGVDRDQCRVARHPFEHGAAESAEDRKSTRLNSSH